MRMLTWRLAMFWTSGALIASACDATGEDDASTLTGGETTPVLPPTTFAGAGGAAGMLGVSGTGAPLPPPIMGAPPVMTPTPPSSDTCPSDPAKTAPGICGCGVADTDSDADRTPDCRDGCPRDPSTAPPLGAQCPPLGGSAGRGSAPVGAAGTGAPPVGTAGMTAAPMPSGSCPEGFQSDRPLVMTGATVPGNLELGLASAPETPRNPCGLPEEQECFRLLNAERMAVGRAPLKWDGDLVDLARSHSADRVQQKYPGTMHGSSTSDTHLYEQRGAFLGLKMGKFKNVVENALTGGRTAQSAVQSWMGSSGHKAVILGDGQWASFTHAGCGRDGSQWNIEFGR